MLALLPSTSAQKIGDVNGDGNINIADVVYLFKNRNVPIDVGDLNCDGNVNVADVVYLFRNYDKFRSPVVFAENFEMEPKWDEGYSYVVDSTGNKFVLLKEGASDPKISGTTVLSVPLTRISTIFYAPLMSTADILDKDEIYDSFKGITNSYAKYSSKIETRYNQGEILGIGSASAMDYDKVVASNPDIVFLGEWVQHDDMENKLKELNILPSRVFTYQEPTFMGRTEWTKFAAAFFGEENSDEIEDYFQDTWRKRNELLRTTSKANDYPTVVSFSWSTARNTATVQGAQNYNSRMVNEFGGEYVFNDIPGSSSNTIDKETFYERAMTADVVIMRVFTGNEIKTKEELLAFNPDFANFKAYQNGRFYTSNRDYFIQEMKDPKRYMEDFARMVQPTLFSGGDSNLAHHNKIQP
ncbi:periplasmic binding protein [Methanococcus vannielii SB]|uniref:Periplasmic binding protein n=2 Tax=Methanococcus vannielii TaxID=2187 RepID=A6UNH0_METVS|nr:periplasmic binding protein [Methanococcus vannielii SB]